METKNLLKVVVCIVLAIFLLLPIHTVKAEGEVDLTALPERLSILLSIPLFAAQLLCSTLFLALFLFPTLMLTKNFLAHLLIGIGVLGFCVAMSWLPPFLLILLVLGIALMMSGKIRGWLTQGEGE